MTPVDGIMMTLIFLAMIIFIVATWLWAEGKRKWFLLFCIVSASVMANIISFFLLSWLIHPRF